MTLKRQLSAALLAMALAATLHADDVSPTASPGLRKDLKKILTQLNLTPQMLQSAGGSMVPGATFSVAKSVSISEDAGDSVGGMNIALQSDGTLASNPLINPHDELHFKLQMDGYLSGTHEGDARPEIARRLLDLRRQIKANAENDEVVNRLSDQMAELEQTNLGARWTLNLAPSFGLESNQAFTRKQVVYDLSARFRYTDWRNKPSWRYLNLFDWPFAISRWVLGFDETFSPEAYDTPSLVLKAQRLKPQDEASLALGGGNEQNTRVGGELSFKTWLDAAMEYSIEGNWQFYQLAGTSMAWADSTYSYFSARMKGPGGIFVQYADGRLPLDLRGSQSYAVGFEMNLGAKP